MSTNVKRNIALLYIIKLAKWFMLFMPIVALFYLENGLAQGDIFLLQALYSAFVVLLEIPSGYAADVWGRKSTLIAGSIAGCLGFVLYSASHGFNGFLLAEFVLAIGHSFVSGADSAMLYDSLTDIKQEKNT
ncbi:MAG: MFS transporter [Bacteroidales bacterium]|nr:MFS transporter [Bacteroidales bacterium]